MRAGLAAANPPWPGGFAFGGRLRRRPCTQKARFPGPSVSRRCATSEPGPHFGCCLDRGGVDLSGGLAPANSRSRRSADGPGQGPSARRAGPPRGRPHALSAQSLSHSSETLRAQRRSELTNLELLGATPPGGVETHSSMTSPPLPTPPAHEAKPVMISVDDDPGVSRAVQRDLRRRYGERFRVLRAESGAQGLELLGQVRLRDESVALLVADQRMPRMNGVEFLEKARELVPRRQAGPAHRLRRHPGGHRRHQPGGARPLPDEAVGPARGAALPGDRRPALGLAGRGAPRRGRAGHRPPLVAPVPRAQGLPGAQRRPLPLDRRREQPGGAAGCWRRRAPTPRPCRCWCSPTAACW